MALRAIIAEHILGQFRSRYLDLHCTTARERYDLLMQRCPGIVEHLDLQDIASFLNVHPNTISKIRRDITFEGQYYQERITTLNLVKTFTLGTRFAFPFGQRPLVPGFAEGFLA